MTDPTDRGSDGYRREPSGGPVIRADVVDVYVFRRGGGGVEFLQVRRAREPLRGTWQPVMGHAEPGESATACARREVREELGLDVASSMCVGFWALEQVHPFFVQQINAVVLSPRFVCEVEPAWEPTLNREHDGARWTPQSRAPKDFLWPGQRLAIQELLESIVPEEAPARRWLAAPRAEE